MINIRWYYDRSDWFMSGLIESKVMLSLSRSERRVFYRTVSYDKLISWWEVLDIDDFTDVSIAKSIVNVLNDDEVYTLNYSTPPGTTLEELIEIFDRSNNIGR